MKRNASRLGAFVLATALVILMGLGTSGVASGKKKHKPLKVSCGQLSAEIVKTETQLQAQYNAMGYTIGVPDEFGDTIDGIGHSQGCQKQGKRIRQGNGFMIDIHTSVDPPFPGETNPDIREYDWLWNEVVTVTKTGQLRDTVINFRCEKYTYDGGPFNPSNIQTFPC